MLQIIVLLQGHQHAIEQKKSIMIYKIFRHAHKYICGK